MPYRLLLKPVLESFIDNVLREQVEPKIGSILFCDLFFNTVEHSGIYIGDNRIVHLDGEGIIEVVSPEKFLARLDGLNTAMSIYVACKGLEPVYREEIAQRAELQIGKRRNYSLLNDNCHQFTAGCITGDFENNFNLFTSLKALLKKELQMDNFRVWDRNQSYNIEKVKFSSRKVIKSKNESKKDFDESLLKFVSILLHYVMNKKEIFPSDILYFNKLLNKYFDVDDISVLKNMFALRNIKNKDIKNLIDIYFSLDKRTREKIDSILLETYIDNKIDKSYHKKLKIEMNKRRKNDKNSSY